ncbi:unnamed protein product (macronuclear) [Paramecium tetraurelia]|uniref:ALMS motif domain-containing protein n=1 Tax=Paramecium tetraurelia TaxID=5888 RepID=A0C9G8_PARTE|nr:uncharacterized protein GSPATT00006741001 [Paramecium tetraurelia]CAK67435.1 unnamed protein product [Paramecium tetraurelia]|eukprot:XP_001434832.1 hypothetical protein (macronuclear) [Paramecium tetraurelia strain d4-2]
MRVSESVGQKLRRVNIDYSQFELPENSLDYYLKPVKPKLNYSKLLHKQQSPHREIPHTISCRIRPQIITQAYNDVINQTSLKTLPIRQLIPQNNNRSFVLKHKKPSIEARYKQIMEYNVEEQFVELRRLMTRQKKSSSLGKRVKFLQ